MNLFQMVVIPLLIVVLIVEVVRFYQRHSHLRSFAFRSIIWLGAIGFILYPDSLTYLARWLGIGFGTNLLLYLLTFAFIAVSFMLYARTVQLRRQLTQLVRHLALSQPLPPASPRKD